MKSQSIQIEGIKSHYKTIGSGKNILLFLHGWGGNTESFVKLATEFIETNTNFTVYILDLPGFGKSDMPPLSGWTTYQYADWFNRFLTNVLPKNSKVNLYGHSFGCRVITRFLQKHESDVESVILTGAAGVKWPKTPKQKILGTTAKILKPLLGSQTSTEWSKGHGLIGKVKRRALRLFGAHDWESCPEQLKPTLTKTLEEDDLRDELKNISIPTLLLWGGSDTYTPLKSAKVYAESLPNNKLVVFPDGRHGIHYTHGTQIIKHMQKFFNQK